MDTDATAPTIELAADAGLPLISANRQFADGENLPERVAFGARRAHVGHAADGGGLQAQGRQGDIVILMGELSNQN